MYQGKNLYVKNLHETCTDEQLRTHFSEYGTVTSAKISTDKSGRSKGFGFVCFSEKESALKALQQHQKMFMDKPLHVAMWQPKTERTQLLKVRHNQQRGGPNPHGMAPMMNNYGMQHMYPPRHMMRPMYRMSRGYPTPMYQQMMAAARSGQPPQMYQGYGNPMNQHMQRVPNGAQNEPRPGAQQPLPPQQHMQRVPEPQPVPVGNQTLTAPELAAAPESERKMMIGNSLYPKIQEIVSKVHDPAELGVTDLAGKITGMLLDGIPDIADLVSLLDNDALLKQRVGSAVEVLRKDQQDKGL